EYTADIEVSLTDSSFLEPVKEYFKNLNLPVLTNISNAEMRISNVSVTTVCLPSGENTSCCSCENGYAWPSEVHSDLIICPSAILAPSLPCSYMREMPLDKPYCKPEIEDSCDMGEPIVMDMSVRLDTVFLEDLSNSSSELYKKYKADLEIAFNAGYRCLPGFVSATVTGFRLGSVFVNYEVKAGAANFNQIASSNRIIPQFLNPLYQLNQTTFTTKIVDQTNFTVSPEDIFEGDTVRLTCEINSTSENVTWYHLGQIISTNSLNFKGSKTSRSTLEVANIKMNDSGSYTCTFTKSNRFHTLIYNATKTVAVSPLNITTKGNDIDVTCNSPEMQTNGLLLSCCIDKHLPSLTGDWKVNGAINITGKINKRFFSENCTEYKLNISESLCPPENSGTVTTYTCELRTGYGARRSQDIRVMYLRAAQVTIFPSVKLQVSEGSEFNLTCKSDVGKYDSVSWKIQSGNSINQIDCGRYITNNNREATSVLRVNTTTWDWNGTCICTFSQKYLESSANVTIEVVPLPLKHKILINPIETSIVCEKPQALECCIDNNTTENYTVRFVVQEKEFSAERKPKGNLLCYTSSYTEGECNKMKKLTSYCKFINSINQEVNSNNITLKVIPGKKEVSCSDSDGVGMEGDTLIKPCCELNNIDDCVQGNRIYKCCNKLWVLEKRNCLSVAINKLLDDAEVTFMTFLEVRELPIYLKKLNETTGMEKGILHNSSANVGAVVSILQMVSSIPADAEPLTIEYFLSVVDIVAESTTETWEVLNNSEEPKSSSLLGSVENFTLNLQPVDNTIPFVKAKTLQLQGMVTENSNTNYNKIFHSAENLTVNVFIDSTENSIGTQNSTIVSVMSSRLGHILPQHGTQYVNGLLLTTTVRSSGNQKFDINMTFAKQDLSLKKPQCVFWNFKLNRSGGGWDTQGCTFTEEEDYVNCSCNHLTSFSILMSPDIRSRVDFEDYITYIGLAISILSLVTCIIVESLVWKYVTNNTTSYMRHVCILNIATSLLIADIWFIVTASISNQNQQMSRDVCLVATFFIHLFYLCVFFWMLSLGLILFYRLVFILHNTSKTIQKAVAFCLGYGCPFVIAVITIAVTLPRNNYTRNDVCWLKWEESKALLAFVVPALIIVAMNLFITAVVIIKILRPNIGDRSNRQERNSLLQIGKSVAILTSLLGLTWGLGLVTVIKNSHRAFHILFVLLNTLQGLFILVFGTLWDKKIQEALLKRNSMSKWSSQQTKVRTL
ncbi:putative G-protein coupled receptor 116, partial [Charadrius vociferus]